MQRYRPPNREGLQWGYATGNAWVQQHAHAPSLSYRGDRPQVSQSSSIARDSGSGHLSGKRGDMRPFDGALLRPRTAQERGHEPASDVSRAATQHSAASRTLSAALKLKKLSADRVPVANSARSRVTSPP
jgi:hypothetical protein